MTEIIRIAPGKAPSWAGPVTFTVLEGGKPRELSGYCHARIEHLDLFDILVDGVMHQNVPGGSIVRRGWEVIEGRAAQ